ncbi:myosin-IIIa [Austrofundulus limnaeus]|uniref:Myosin-IIIa n=1 Tax=Austrofundulus limnaeus TaxID=52670 RepID=A0A2I4AZF7_AUSLI|nr:PREDICTED: myosin-IIIa-like [Austrofundulus limnaeus]
MTTENTSDGTPERRQSMDRRESTEETPAGSSRPMRERAITEPELPKPAKDKRRSVPRMSSTESRTADNPYDYRHLLRKTSQRRKLIKQY